MLAGDEPGRLKCERVGMLRDAVDMFHSREGEVQPHGTGTWMEKYIPRGHTMGTILGRLEVPKNTKPTRQNTQQSLDKTNGCPSAGSCLCL